MFKVIIPLNPHYKTVGEVFLLIKEKPSITRKELSLITGLSVRGVEYNLKKLKELEFIIRRGSTKTGYWEVKPWKKS